MPSKLAGILTELRKRQVEESIPFVFQNKIGGPLDPDSLYDVLNAAQDAAEVRRFGLHGLRHLYCSLLQESGASLKFAQERLGHANSATTANIYTHVVSDHGHQFAESVEAAFPFASVSNLLAKPELGEPRRDTASPKSQKDSGSYAESSWLRGSDLN